MKKTVFFGLLAILLTFDFIGCDNGSNGTTTFTVTFDSNGGSSVASITGISSSATITLPTQPTKVDNIFSGWFIDNETFENEFTASTLVTENIIVYAKWTPIEGEPYDGPKTIKIIGFNLQQAETYIYIFSDSKFSWPPVARDNKVSEGQTITYTMVDEQSGSEPWTGTGKYFIMFENMVPKNDPSKDGAAYFYSVDGINPVPVDINDAVKTLEWSKFIWLHDFTAG